MVHPGSSKAVRLYGVVNVHQMSATFGDQSGTGCVAGQTTHRFSDVRCLVDGGSLQMTTGSFGSMTDGGDDITASMDGGIGDRGIDDVSIEEDDENEKVEEEEDDNGDIADARRMLSDAV